MVFDENLQCHDGFSEKENINHLNLLHKKLLNTYNDVNKKIT